MKTLNRIKLLLWLIVFVGAGSAYYDYTRITDGLTPVFCKRSYDERSKVETFRGLFYVAERTVKVSTEETLNISSDISYRFLNQRLNIKVKAPKDEYDFVLLVTPAIQCPSPSKLYYEWEYNKLYLDCVIDIKVKEKDSKEAISLKEDLEKNPSRVEDILKNFDFVGIANDKSTERYVTKDTSFSNKKLYAYRCHNQESKDIYITMNPNMAPDYCTLKMDTLKKPEEEPKEEEKKSGQE